MRDALQPGEVVLVVDDEDAVRRLLARILERAGYPVLGAADATEAHGVVDRERVALVLSDVNMPGETGLELARSILRDHAETAVVMVTAVDDTALAEEALDIGAYGYVIKPFEPNEILITVANALRRRMLEIENAHHRARLEELVAARTARLQEALSELTRADQTLRHAHEEAIRRLAHAAEFRDPFIGDHLKQMSRYCEILALGVGMKPDEAEMLRVAAPMHDIGKIGVPEHILLKPGKLTEEEFTVIKTHPRIGHEILAGSDAPLLQLGAEIALTHHERWGGGGYPAGLRGVRIPVAARIVAVADVFDALTTARPYKDAYAVDHAVDIMRADRGRHFDPDVFDVLVDGLDAVLAVITEHHGADAHAGFVAGLNGWTSSNEESENDEAALREVRDVVHLHGGQRHQPPARSASNAAADR